MCRTKINQYITYRQKKLPTGMAVFVSNEYQIQDGVETSNRLIINNKPSPVFAPYLALSALQESFNAFSSSSFDVFESAVKNITHYPQLDASFLRSEEKIQPVEEVVVIKNCSRVVPIVNQSPFLDLNANTDKLKQNGFFAVKTKPNVFQRRIKLHFETFPKYCVSTTNKQFIDFENGTVCEVCDSEDHFKVLYQLSRDSLSLADWLCALKTRITDRPLKTWYWTMRLKNVLFFNQLTNKWQNIF